MKTVIKRLRVSLGTSFDAFINRVENHEALVGEAIREAQSAVARARVKLNHVHRDGEALQERLEGLQRAIGNWQSRARQQADSNRERALECLRRRQEAEAELAHLERETRRHAETERALTGDIAKLEAHIAALKRRKHALAARDFRSKALQCGQVAEGACLQDLEDIFERWELKLAESEAGIECATDTFEESFVTEENRQALEAELDALLAAEPAEK